MLLRLTALLLLALAPAAHAQGIDWSGRYWTCDIWEKLGEGPNALTGHYGKTFNFEGTLSAASYEAWGPIRLRWQFTQDGGHFTDLGVETLMWRDPSGVHAELFAGDAPVSKLTLLTPDAYARGYSSNAPINFYGPELARLAADDRWTLVVRTGAGTELVRRVLPVPARRLREQAFARYKAAVAAAFRARDETRLETADPATLGPGPHCLLSTPQTREEMQDRSIIEEPMPAPRLRRP